MGRMAHDTRRPPVSSVQLQPSIPVVCMEPAVLPLEKALTSRSCTPEYVTAATPNVVSTANGQRPILALLPSLWPMYTAVAPSVTAYSQSVRPTTTVPALNTVSAAIRSGIIALSLVAHCGGSPPSTVSTMSSATLTQLSMARPRLLRLAAKKLKNGARSGVHMRMPYWLSSFSMHLVTVAFGITMSSWMKALTRSCTASAKLRSSKGYTTRSSGAARVEQKALSRRRPCAANSLTSAMLVSRSRIPLSGCKQETPLHRNDSKN
jgi:hypothetical protein